MTSNTFPSGFVPIDQVARKPNTRRFSFGNKTTGISITADNDTAPLLKHTNFSDMTEELNNDEHTRDVQVSEASSPEPEVKVKHKLKTRHLSMMALAGIIGPGLLIGTGKALADGGPASLIISFGLMGIVAFCMMQSLGEMTTLYPDNCPFITLADRFYDPALAFAIGWAYFFIWSFVLGNEYNILSNVLHSWYPGIPIWAYFIICWTFFTGIQLLGVEKFGEIEFWLALIKIIGIVAFNIFGIVYASGGIKGKEAIGFKYWSDPGAFNNGFRGVASTFVYCATFYVGCESVAVTAGEAKNPQKAVPAAVRQLFWRIILIYLGTALIYGITVPYNETQLGAGGHHSMTSPMTIALANAGWAAGGHVVNTFILVTCLSAVNGSCYLASRTLLYMAQQGKAWKKLAYTDKRGVPLYTVLLTSAFGFLSLMNLKEGVAVAYAYITNISGVFTFLVWGCISYTHIRFRKAWIAQGHTLDELPYKALLFPYTAIFGIVANIILLAIQGYPSLYPKMDVPRFIDAYIGIIVFILLFFGFKVWKKTKIVDFRTVDLNMGMRCESSEIEEIADDFELNEFVASEEDFSTKSSKDSQA